MNIEKMQKLPISLLWTSIFLVHLVKCNVVCIPMDDLVSSFVVLDTRALGNNISIFTR